mmetsp:Transcript_6777/g.14982  ORF Transcript_6777/g.14982 Transcript_6777/m.14982 type:complete len:294 (+) Transcript_6777:589-1470(+)
MGNLHLQLPLLQPPQHLVHALHQHGRLLLHVASPKDTVHRGILDEEKVGSNLRDAPGCEADDQVLAAPGHQRLEGLVKLGASHGVIHHIHSFGSKLLDDFVQRRLAGIHFTPLLAAPHCTLSGVNHMLHTHTAHEGHLGRPRHHCHHLGTQCFADLAGCHTHSPSSTQDQQRLTWLQLSAVPEGKVRGAVHNGHSRRILQWYPLWDVPCCCLRNHNLLSKGSTSTHGTDLVPNLEALDTRPNLSYHTRHLVAGNEWQLGFHLVLALNLQGVWKVDASGGDVDAHMLRFQGQRG